MTFYHLPLMSRLNPTPTTPLTASHTFVRRFKSTEGTVVLARSRTSHKLRIIKTVRHADPILAPREAYLLSLPLSNHENIIRLFATEFEPLDGLARMCFEHCSGGDLLGQINRFFALRMPVPALFVVHVWISVCEAMAFIHHGITYAERDGYTRNREQTSILHRDIKEDNIFLRFPGSMPGLPDVVLADFGCASLAHLAHDGFGAPAYWAPEVVLGRWQYVTAAADVYAFGVMMHNVLLMGGGLWRMETHPRYLRIDPSYEDLPLRRLLQGCLQIDPLRRAEMTEDGGFGILREVRALRRIREIMGRRGDRVDPGLWAGEVGFVGGITVERVEPARVGRAEPTRAETTRRMLGLRGGYRSLAENRPQRRRWWWRRS